MMRRNDALHGNVDPKKKTGDPIYFDCRTIPLVEVHKSLSRTSYDHITAGTSTEAALLYLETAQRFVEFVSGHLETGHQAEVKLIFNELHPGFRPATGSISAILPRAFVDGYLRKSDGTLIR